MKGLDDALEEVLLQLAGPDSAAPLLLAEIRLMGGALANPLRRAGRDADPDPDADCVGGRDAALSFFAVGVMAPPIAHLVTAAIEAARLALQPFGTGGTAVNLHGHLTSPDLAASAWPEAARLRLSEAKAELDPKNLFRHGHAILPAAAVLHPAVA